jgi:hypothetical protein
MQYSWPALDAATLLKGVRLLMVIVVATALVWLLFGVLFKRQREAWSGKS